MKFKCKALAKTVLFAFLTLVCCLAASAVELFPDESDGSYRYTYTEARPGREYVVIVFEGEWEDGVLPDLADAEVLYYNQHRADVRGCVDLSFVPISYRTGTLYLAGGELDMPVKLGVIRPGSAKDIASLALSTEKSEYTVIGSGAPIYVRYTVDVRDSFGFPTMLPKNAERSFDSYTGDKMRFLPGANTIELSSNLEAGTYTFTVSCDGEQATASFTVLHEASAATSVRLTVDGSTVRTAYIDCINDLDSAAFEPESIELQMQTLDQYGDPMEDVYTYGYSVTRKVDGVDTVLRATYAETDEPCHFVPPTAVPYNTTETYDMTVTSHLNPALSATVRIVAVGNSDYKGEQLYLYQAVTAARKNAAQLEDGSVVVSVDGTEVPATKSWVSVATAETLLQELSDAEAMVRTPVSNLLMQNKRRALMEASAHFENNLKKGLLAYIESIRFDSDRVDLALGRSTTVTAVIIPARPSEYPVYTSSDPGVATVNPQTGKVSAVSEGMTVITAANQAGDISAYYELYVYKPISSVKSDKNSYTVVAGGSFKAALTVSPADHSDVLTLSSSDEAVARVANGMVYGVSAGKATITAVSKSGASASFTVTVEAPVFSVKTSMLTKPGSTATVSLLLDNGYAVATANASLAFDARYFTLTSVKETDLTPWYGGSVEIENGNYNSMWNFEGYNGSVKGTLVTYEFAVSDDAPLGSYTFTAVLNAETANQDAIRIENSVSEATVTVGEKDTYTVRTVAEANGSVSGSGEYAYGASATVKASPNSNYDFSAWYDGNVVVSTVPTYTFTVTRDITLTARFTRKTPQSTGGGGGGDGGGRGGNTSTPIVIGKAAAVTADVASGVIQPGTKITLSCSTAGAVIYYTTDGSVPTAGTGIRYTDPVAITQNETLLRAVAVKNGMTNSDPVSFTYRFLTDEVTEGTKIALKADAAQIKYLITNGPYVRPNDAATRYEVIEMLAQLFDVTGVTPQASFSDLSGELKETVELYAAAGILNGYPDGTFGGQREITRAEFVKILCVMLGIDKEQADNAVSAVSLSDIAGHWAEDNIRRFVAKGYILGYPEGDFRPDKQVTRAEAVAILNRIIGTVKTENAEPVFNDLTQDFWGYDDIMSVYKAVTASEEPDNGEEVKDVEDSESSEESDNTQDSATPEASK